MREKQVPVDVVEMKGENLNKCTHSQQETKVSYFFLFPFQRASLRLPGNPTAASLLFCMESPPGSAPPSITSKTTERSSL